MPSTTPPLYVGIDLGTTNSTAAVFDGSEVAVVRNGQGSMLTPSVVRIDARGNVLVGARARRHLDTDPANTRAEFKRLMGTAHELEFPASGARRRPEQLAAEVLAALRRDIADQTGAAPERAVVSVPALFELHQTAATSEAARLAGFERIELIQEPVASAIAAGWTRETGDGPWLVYDLGGGTFDVSLLDSREGMLRVVGHDGDNFLGGRDFDRAIVDLALEKLGRDGSAIDPADPRHALALRRLRYAAEEAKIELTRAREAALFLGELDLGTRRIEVDLALTRAEYEQRIAPLVDRSLEICLRLLAANGLEPGGLQRLVLVGGPTVTPLLREKIKAVLGAEFGTGLDPMTLVAQGAALFAASVGLDARPAAPAAAAQPDAAGPKVWLQFPAVTADLTPFVVGKLLERANPPGAIRIARSDGQWQSEAIAPAADGSFEAMLSLLPRQQSVFEITGEYSDGRRQPLTPPSFAVAHGMTLGDPPLARSIGVALADDQVLVYFERGAPLPIRRSFTLHTAQTVAAGGDGYALKVPIVQGEFHRAHLCRLVGTLEIPGSALPQSLPIGTEVEVMLELDRGGQLRASARVANLDQLFSHVALLVTPQLALDEAEAALAKLEARARDMSRSAFLNRSSAGAGKLSSALAGLETLRRNLAGYRGGDLDAGEQVRRGLIEFDALLADMEAELAWPELARRLEDDYTSAVAWAGNYGTDAERTTLNRAYQNARQALAAQQPEEVERQLALIHKLRFAAARRSPDYWFDNFDYVASCIADCTDIRRARELVTQGEAALAKRDRARLEEVVRALWKLFPVDQEQQRLGHGSGLRRR